MGVVDCRASGELVRLRVENRMLRVLLDIAHLAHHRGLDHCPLCEEVAEAADVPGATHG